MEKNLVYNKKTKHERKHLGPYSRTSYDTRRLLIGRDGRPDLSEAYDVS